MLLTNDHVYNNILWWSRMARYFGMSGCSNRATYVSPRPSEVPTSRGERRPGMGDSTVAFTPQRGKIIRWFVMGRQQFRPVGASEFHLHRLTRATLRWPWAGLGCPVGAQSCRCPTAIQGARRIGTTRGFVPLRRRSIGIGRRLLHRRNTNVGTHTSKRKHVHPHDVRNNPSKWIEDFRTIWRRQRGE